MCLCLYQCLIFTVLAMSLDVICGYAGLLSFAQVGFLGLGGYATALTATKLDGAPGSGWWSRLCPRPLGGRTCGGRVAIVERCVRHCFNHIYVAAADAFRMDCADKWTYGIPGLPAPSVGFGADAIVLNAPRLYYYLALLFFLRLSHDVPCSVVADRPHAAPDQAR